MAASRVARIVEDKGRPAQFVRHTYVRIEEPQRLFRLHHLRNKPLKGVMTVATLVIIGFLFGLAAHHVLPNDQVELIAMAMLPIALSFTYFRARA
jgi:hypothetical protein